jgi:phosphatidylinositol 4-kinase
LLQIKDRHNGNILLDVHGHVSHIDFGFMLTNSPGSVGFEMAPFKLPQEYIDVLGGIDSETFEQFRELFKLGFLALRKRADIVLGMVEIMEKDSRLPCFTGMNKQPSTIPNPIEIQYPVTNSLRDRFHLSMTDDSLCGLLDQYIDSSAHNMFTKMYDTFQVLFVYLVLCKWNFINIYFFLKNSLSLYINTTISTATVS